MIIPISHLFPAVKGYFCFFYKRSPPQVAWSACCWNDKGLGRTWLAAWSALPETSSWPNRMGGCQQLDCSRARFLSQVKCNMISTQTQPSHHPISRLDLASFPMAEETLARAFEGDPMTPYIFPSDTDIQKRLRAVFRVELRCPFRPGVVEVIGEGKAVTIWLPPGRMKGALAEMLGSGILLAPLRLGLGATWRGTLLLKSIQELHSRSVSGDHWYLLALAVHSGHQGSGWGSQLMRHGLARAQSRNLPSYLETTNPRNIAFYQRHGFKLVGERAVAGGGPMVWGMLCPAAA